jgi:hypothetical protein
MVDRIAPITGPTGYDYGRTPGLFDIAGLLDAFTPTRREIVSPSQTRFEDMDGLMYPVTTPAVYGEPETGIEYMPAYRAASSVADYLGGLLTGGEEEREMLVEGAKAVPGALAGQIDDYYTAMTQTPQGAAGLVTPEGEVVEANPLLPMEYLLGGSIGAMRAGDNVLGAAGGRGMIGHNRPPVVVGQTPYIVTNELRGTQFRTAQLPDGSRTLIDAAGNPYIEEKTLNKLLTGVPHTEMTSVFTPPPPGVLQPEVAVSPEMFENSWMLNLSGDRTRYGNLSRVNDTDLYGGGVDLEGGDEFMRSLRATWASAPSAISAIENQVNQIREGLLGGNPDAPIYGITTNMAERSGDFAVDTAETIMRMIPNSPIKKADFQEFEKAIKEKYPDYPGMKDPDKALEWLMKDAETKGAGNRRLFFVQEAAKGKYQKAGFPDIGSVRAAISKPETQFMPYGRTGGAIGLLAPEGQLATRLRFADILRPHKTYPDMIGDPLGYRGGYEVTVDRSLGFPDAYSYLYGRGSDASGVRRAFDIGREMQFMRPDVVDAQMQFIEDQQRMLRNAGLLNDMY